MAGIVSPSMAVYVTSNDAFGVEIYTTFNMGLGKVLRMGAYGPEIIEKLRWMNGGMAEVLERAIAACGGLDVKQLMVQALQMGDELHNRNKAASSLFLRALAPFIAAYALQAAMTSAAWYNGSPAATRAEPKMLTAGPKS